MLPRASPEIRVFFSVLNDKESFCVCVCAPFFPQAGNVKFADLFQEPGGRSKGCAVVEYETAQEAHAAIRDLHDTDLMGRLIFVREDREEVRGGVITACT